MKKKIRILVIVLLVAAAAAAVGAAGVWRYLDTPAGSDRLEKYVEIPPGAHFMEVAGILEREGIIRGVRRFRWLAWFKGNETRIKAGEYAFYAAMRPSEVLDRMVRGESRTIRVTIPEGFTMRQIADLLAKKELADGVAFFLPRLGRAVRAFTGRPERFAGGLSLPRYLPLYQGYGGKAHCRAAGWEVSVRV